MDKPIWATRLKELRLSRGLTQKEVVELLGRKGVETSKSSVSKWENGTHETGNYALRVLADYYDVSIDWIFGREKNGQENKLRTERH